MPEAVIRTATKGFGVFTSPVLALAMSAVVRGVPACQDPRVGQRDSRRGGPRGWAPRSQRLRDTKVASQAAAPHFPRRHLFKKYLKI